MFQRIRTYCLSGIRAIPVSVEVDASPGLPGFTLVGLPDNAVRESRERVVSAVRSIGKVVTGHRTTVNLSPADLKKEGALLDLSLAIGLLIASGEIAVKDPERFVFLGELSLDGLLKPVRGVLSVAMSLKSEMDLILIVPKENLPEASLVEGLSVFGAESLAECVDFLVNPTSRNYLRAKGLKAISKNTFAEVPDFSDIVGLETVKRALEIAAAGGHNFLLIGSPGTGKTLSARCLPGILPDMTDEEILESTTIHSCANARLSADFQYISVRPFRAPHHSASMVSLVGGGARLLPGEASLAHNGVLFLDELPEFNRMALEALREPMESGKIVITRASGSSEWPANFMLGAAMNPCPCGYAMDSRRGCTCLPEAKKRYREKVSGPLLDRIDLQIAVPSVDATSFAEHKKGESSKEIRERVMAAREIQKNRNSFFKPNAALSSKEAVLYAKMNKATERFAVESAEKLMLSARGYYRLLKVARTIADLHHAECVEIVDLLEALQYRRLRNFSD